MDTISCVALDWGTSRLRLWVIDSAGNIVAQRQTDEGLEGARALGFAATLENHLAALGVGPDVPVIICGMAGSRQGWVEAPYVDTPAPLSEIILHAIKVSGISRDVRILPGVAQRSAIDPDVMRGEETQLLGLITDASRQLVCMPGTHSKWVEVSQNTVQHFTTFITGELFALFAGHSLLRHSVGDVRTFPHDTPAFADACADMIAHPQALSQRLFSVRAASLLHGFSQQDCAAKLSGLLIGAEIGGAKLSYGTASNVTLVGVGGLGKLYEKALQMAGFSYTVTDGEALVRAGLIAAAQQFWPSRF
jgi:2-dehydro-3-deoxygalactonokinase